MRRHLGSLKGKVIAITGGARGIGLATASDLIEQGARVSIGDIDYELAESAARDLGTSACSFELDVTDRDSFEEFVSETQSKLGPLDTLINNAGIMPIARLVDESDETSAQTVDVNLHGVINGMKLALPGMLERNQGQIVNIASVIGKVAVPGVGVYTASKFAVVGLTEAARGEITGSGVQLTLVLPTIVSTELAAGVPMGRGLKPVTAEDVARAIVTSIIKKQRDVYVPRHMRALCLATPLLPARFTDRVRHLVMHDRLLESLDLIEREGYDRRVSSTREQQR